MGEEMPWPQLPANRIEEIVKRYQGLNTVEAEEEEGMGIEIALITMMFTIAMATPVAVWAVRRIQKKLRKMGIK